jgi:hypothetical protein
VAAEAEDAAAVTLEGDLESKLVPKADLLYQPFIPGKGKQPLRAERSGRHACGECITHGNAIGTRRFTHYFLTFPLNPRFRPHEEDHRIDWAGRGLALTVSALAQPHPAHADKRAATAECKTLRGTVESTQEAFLTQFRNFGACVSKKAVEEAVEEQNAHTNAAKECRTERGTTTGSRQAFNEQYGTNGREGTKGFGRNAFGKCVSETAEANNEETETAPQS